MSTDVEQKLVESLDVLTRYAQQGADFAVEQSPLVAQEIVYFGIVEGAMTAIGGLLCVWLTYRIHKWIMYAEHDRESMEEFVYIPAALLGLLGVGFVYNGLLCAFKAIVAPRLFVLERLGELL
jgi:hypothetical protein